MQKKDEHIGQKLKSYTFIRKLGAGAWATVYEVFDDKTKTSVACKILKKSLMDQTPKLKQLVQTEITVLRRCMNDNVIRFVDTFSNNQNVYILTEFCNGGDMEEYLKKKGGKLREGEALEYLKQILNGFRGLHEVGAMHRDFKAANILMHNEVAKIADLGFAKILQNQVVTSTILGTSVTMAPELLENKSYGFGCDIWSVGVVYYQFLTGDYPYNAINDMEILKKIKKGSPSFPQNIKISKESMDFILKCLTVDPVKRITWKAIYEHPLLQDKSNKIKDTYIGGLKSTIDVNNNRNFYNKQIPGMVSPNNFEFPVVQLEETQDFERIRKEVEYKKYLDSKILQYTQTYLERRNHIMLILKHGITPIYDLQNLPISHQLYAFLMCKKAFMDMSQFMLSIQNKANLFKITEFWNEFIAKPEYSRLFELLRSDNEMIYNYAVTFMTEVKTKNPKVQGELNLKSSTAMFPTIYREELTSYSYLLFDYRDRPDVSKPVIMKLITFLCDLINGISISSEQYDKALENLDIKLMEDRFLKSLQALYNGQH